MGIEKGTTHPASEPNPASLSFIPPRKFFGQRVAWVGQGRVSSARTQFQAWCHQIPAHRYLASQKVTQGKTKRRKKCGSRSVTFFSKVLPRAWRQYLRDKEKTKGLLLTIMQSTLSKVMVEYTLRGSVSASTATTQSTDVHLWIKFVLTKIFRFTQIQLDTSGSRQVRLETSSSNQLSASSSTDHIMRKLTGTASPAFKLKCGKRGIVQRTHWSYRRPM